MNIKIKKLNPHATIPKYAKEGDAALDLVATGCKITNDYTEYKTGLAMEIPEGYVGLIFPRSSVSERDLVLANSVGVIDSGYRGEILIRFKRTKSSGEAGKDYDLGEKVAQILIIPIPYITFVESEELSETERSDGGFGSTGK